MLVLCALAERIEQGTQGPRIRGQGTWGPGIWGQGTQGPGDLATQGPEDLGTRGTQGLTLECTVCVHTVASSLGKYPGPHVEHAFSCVDLCLYSLEWNVDWSSGMGYRFF